MPDLTSKLWPGARNPQIVQCIMHNYVGYLRSSRFATFLEQRLETLRDTRFDCRRLHVRNHVQYFSASHQVLAAAAAAAAVDENGRLPRPSEDGILSITACEPIYKNIYKNKLSHSPNPLLWPVFSILSAHQSHKSFDLCSHSIASFVSHSHASIELHYCTHHDVSSRHRGSRWWICGGSGGGRV